MRLITALTLTLGTLHGQAIIEYGVGAGRSGAAGATIGKSVSNTIRQLDKTLAAAATGGASPQHAQSPAVVVPAAVAAPEPTAPATPVDFAEIVIGMDKADLLKKAGKPGMSLTSTESSTLVETCWYRSGEDRVTVVLRNGKVAKISGAENLSAK